MNKDEALKMAIAELSKEEGWMDNVEATINACKEALEQPAQDDYKIGYEHGKQHFLEKYYKGNSIQHWHNKAVAYGNTISELWTVLKSKGFGADGKTSIIDMLGKALEQPTVAELNNEYLRDTNVEGLNQPTQENCAHIGMDKCPHEGVCQYCKQPAQEPVAWIKEFELLYMKAHKAAKIMNWKTNLGLKPEPDDVPLYTHPHQWQGLTDDEIKEIWLKLPQFPNHFDISRAIEQALKEKNS